MGKVIFIDLPCFQGLSEWPALGITAIETRSCSSNFCQK